MLPQLETVLVYCARSRCVKSYLLMFCTDGGLILKGTGQAIIPEVIRDQQGDSSAGQEPTTMSIPSMDSEIQIESTPLWGKKEGSVKILCRSAGPHCRFECLESNMRLITPVVSPLHCTPTVPEAETRNLILQWWNKPPQKEFIWNCLCTSGYFKIGLQSLARLGVNVT